MTEEEIALACASHSGEEAHVGRVTAFLSRIGVPPEKLQCGAHAPYNAATHERVLRAGQEVTALHNNCSGKHAGMLAMAKYLGADLDTYMDPMHPLQQQIFTVVSEVCEVPLEQIVVGVDGCGVPVFAVPAAKLALAFAKFVDPSGLEEKRARAMRRITLAMMRHPHLVAGTERFCTGLMEAGEERILGKAGAEGVYCAGVVESGVGLCVKVADGNARAAYPAVVEALQQANLVNPSLIDKLAAFHRPTLRNHKGTVVGEIRPAFTLTKH